jgi:hypothetical protein
VGAIHALSSIGAILAIIGGTDANNPAQIYSQRKLHYGVIILAVVWAIIYTLAVVAWTFKRQGGSGEGLLITSVLCALPLIGIRTLYSLLAVLSHASAFSSITPTTTSTTVDLFMAVIMEMLVTCIYLAAGLKLPKRDSRYAPGREGGQVQPLGPLPMAGQGRQKYADRRDPEY